MTWCCFICRDKVVANPMLFENDFNEAVWCKILLNKTSTLLLGCVYRSPNSSLENSEHLITLLKEVGQEKYFHHLVMGDFNYREINWTDSSTNVGENHVASLFLECIRDTYLCQYVTEPTRIRENNEPSTLDLVLTNEENMVHNLSYNPELGKSDHLTLSSEYLCFFI